MKEKKGGGMGRAGQGNPKKKTTGKTGKRRNSSKSSKSSNSSKSSKVDSKKKKSPVIRLLINVISMG